MDSRFPFPVVAMMATVRISNETVSMFEFFDFSRRAFFASSVMCASKVKVLISFKILLFGTVATLRKSKMTDGIPTYLWNKKRRT